jgi:hypothetical protein
MAQAFNLLPWHDTSIHLHTLFSGTYTAKNFFFPYLPNYQKSPLHRYFLLNFFPLSTGKYAFRIGNATQVSMPSELETLHIASIVPFLFMHKPGITIFHKVLWFNTTALTTQLPRVF